MKSSWIGIGFSHHRGSVVVEDCDPVFRCDFVRTSLSRRAFDELPDGLLRRAVLPARWRVAGVGGGDFNELTAHVVPGFQ